LETGGAVSGGRAGIGAGVGWETETGGGSFEDDDLHIPDKNRLHVFCNALGYPGPLPFPYFVVLHHSQDHWHVLLALF
jgi:hypothetical protein